MNRKRLFCSNCGKSLGAVAHIYKNELLCEDCFLRVQANQEAPNTPSTTVLIGKHDDQERAEASNGNFEAQEPPETSTPASQAAAPSNPTQQQNPPATQHPHLLYPNEEILWRRTFSKGIVHRNPTFTEVVTNLRALVVDDTLGSIVRACPLRNSAVVVTNTRRDSNRTSMGYGYYGRYSGASMGSSHTIGDLQFLLNGNIALSFHNVSDPQGLKSLVQGTIKSMT